MTSILLLCHLLAFLVLFTVLLNASPSPDPSPAPAPAVISVPLQAQPRQRQITSRKAVPPAPEIEHDLLDFVLISTIDGGLHAVERKEGKIKWSLKDGIEPLIAGGVRGEGLDEYIVEPLTGALYVFDQEEGESEPKLRKLPLTVEQLIDLSPFTFPQSPDRIFTGSKQTSLITLDLRTGEQIDCFSPANISSKNAVCANDQLLDDLERTHRSNKDTLFVGRTDYRLVIHSTPHSGASSLDGGNPRQGGVQEIAYSTYMPNSFDKPLAEYWSRVGATEKVWDSDGGEADRTRVELNHNGVAIGVGQGAGYKWYVNLGSIGIAVYDLLLPLTSGSANPILVPQPPPHIQSMFPTKHRQAVQSPLNPLGKAPSTYIGSVPFAPALSPPVSPIDEVSDESSTSGFSSRPLLYALSSDSYPLINFAPPPKPGSFANGSFLISEDIPEQDHLLPYLLDPPVEDTAQTLPETNHSSDDSDAGDREAHGRGWAWWLIGLIVGGMVCALGLARYARSGLTKQTSSPTNERTPLLVEPANEASINEKDAALEGEKPRSVTLVESAADQGEVALVGTQRSESTTPTPKKNIRRRRVRGKKKKDDNLAVGDGEKGESDGEEKGEDDSSGSGSNTQATTPNIKMNGKPLPELPTVLSSSDIADKTDREQLSVSDTVLGYGSQGTVVLKGMWGGRPVAVKRVLSHFPLLASQEVRLLQASDDHPNVIRYFCQEPRDNFLYIALDLCETSLWDMLQHRDQYQHLMNDMDTQSALIQITSGVKHLHSLKIIHRDIKPQNVLVTKGKNGKLRMQVSDFGIARRLDHDQTSFAATTQMAAGSLGWRAPECIRGHVQLDEIIDNGTAQSSSTSSTSSSTTSVNGLSENADKSKKTNGRLTKAVDLFALGCLYFWVMTNGKHPYGQDYDRESNIVRGDPVSMGELDILGADVDEARDLITKMLSMDPEARPDTATCLKHPYFWDSEKKLRFLCEASNRFEDLKLDPQETSLVMLETDAVSVVGKDWHSRMDKIVTKDLTKYRKYQGDSVRDLLRAMRNKKSHYSELEPAQKRHLGDIPKEFLYYFTYRYPKLFLHVYGVITNSRLKHEKMFESFFTEAI